ncbi:MAG: Peptidylprolyl isomerase [Acidobacteria bacterium]|jgi:peptidyl-prolyl cis-trans isomerase D|nr:Peptidylprolyl isomerase [Acidobacteriota bacterium]
MLKFFSRLEKTRNFIILIFALLLIFSMIFIGATLFDQPTQTNVSLFSTEAVADVGDESITAGELARQKESMTQFGGQTLPAKFMLDGMIRNRITRIEAERLGLRATDAEVAAEIREQLKSDTTPFDQKRYEQSVTDQFGSVAAYEQAVRDQLSAKKLEAFITSSVTVSEEELLNDFKRKSTRFDLSYVPVNTADLAQTIKPTDEELQNYFNQNKQNYFINVPQKKIRYVFLNTAKIGEKLPISDEDLRAEYDKLPAERKKAGVNGQEIVLRVSKPEFEAQVMEKAAQIVQDARKNGGKISEEAFADLARGQSENPASARNGGKLPGLVKENPSKPDDPYQQLLTMQPGEITDPVVYQSRVFILRRGEDAPKSFEDAKKELEVSLRNRRAYGIAAELAQKASESLRQSKDVQKTAAEFAAQANMTPTEMIRETGYIKPGDTVENIGISPQFEEGIAKLENVNDAGERIPVQNGFAIPLLVDKKEPRDAAFEEVKDQIAESVKLEKARTQVEEIAKQIAAEAGSASALSAAATAKGLKVQEQKGFILGTPIGQGPSASTSDALEDAIYAMKDGEVTKTPLKVGDNWYIVGVNKREETNMDTFASQHDQLMQTMLQEKRGTVFSDYLASIRHKMEADGDIKVYSEVLKKIDPVQETISEDGTKTLTY